MKRMFIAIASLGTLLATSNATSLVDRDPDEISDSLAKLTVAAFYCAGNFHIQHNVVDLVWDILQLKTGVDPDSNTGKRLRADRANAIEAVARNAVRSFCDRVLVDYGPQGKSIAGLVDPR